MQRRVNRSWQESLRSDSEDKRTPQSPEPKRGLPRSVSYGITSLNDKNRFDKQANTDISSTSGGERKVREIDIVNNVEKFRRDFQQQQETIKRQQETIKRQKKRLSES